MIVNVYCSRCVDDKPDDPNDPIPMEPIGPLTLSVTKWQSQEYVCRVHNFYVRVHINTTLEKDE